MSIVKHKNNFKKIIGKLHLWLGLLSGIIVFIISLTGCIYVFSREFTYAFRKDILYVTPKENTIPIDKLWENTQKQLGENTELSWVNIYNAPDRSWIFLAYKPNEDENAFTYFETLSYYKSVYVNPYTGDILRIYDEKTDFFNIVKMIHWSLLLSNKYGQPVVGYATLIFVCMFITGLILWWPKNKAARKQRFSFKWKKGMSWKRKNYDLHNILGFYIGSVAFVISVTGLVWAFSWMQSLVYIAGARSFTPPDLSLAKSVYTPSHTSALNQAFATSKKLYPDADGFQLTPATGDSTSVIQSYIQPKEGLYYINHNLQFDKYSGKLLKERKHQDKNFGEKLITANYDIHVGAIVGIPGKIIAFTASLLCASLPVTGFMIWLGRKRKKKPSTRLYPAK